MLHEITPLRDPLSVEAVQAAAAPGEARVEGRMTAVRENLTARAEAVATGLRDSFTPVVRAVAGASPRPASLARSLSVDRTLAARLLRAVRAGDSVQLLHEIPAPGGLRILLDAAEAAGVGAELRAAADGAVRRFEALINEFPGGRAALDAALGGLDEGVRQRNVRAATQAIHRSMTSLLGYQADVMLATVFVQPSADPSRVDALYILGKYGVRRLRASSPITVFGWRGEVPEAVGRSTRRVETIDGQVEPENGNAYLLTEYCSRPTPPLSLYRSRDLFLYTLAESVPPINVPVTLVGAQVIRSAGVSCREEDLRFHWETHTPRFPCRVLVADVFVRDDLFGGGAPTLSTTLHSIASGAARPDAPAFKLDDVAIAPPVVSLGTGLAGAGTRDVPRYTEMLGATLGRAGWDSSRFRGYRCRIQYPVPLVSVTFWFDLPAGQGS